MAVLDPLRVVIENYPEDRVEEMEAVNNPEDPSAGTRMVPFSRELYVERDDFREDPPPKFHRLAPGREVRLRYSYIVKCVEAVKDPATGEVAELRCTYDPDSKSGSPGGRRRVRGTVHWVSAAQSVGAQVRLYDRLFTKEDPDDAEPGLDFTSNLNPDSPARPSRVQAGARPGRRSLRNAAPVRAAGLLLRRRRLDPRQPGLQPHHPSQGHLGPHREGAAGTVGLQATPSPLSPGRSPLRAAPVAT